LKRRHPAPEGINTELSALEQGRAEGRLLGRQSQQVGGDAHLPVALLTGADANDRDRQLLAEGLGQGRGHVLEHQ